MPALGRTPSCVQAEPPRLPWVPRLREALQALAVPGIKTQSQRGTQPKPVAAPRPLLQGFSPREKANPSHTVTGASPSQQPCSVRDSETSQQQERAFPGTERASGRATDNEFPADGAGRTSNSTHPACTHVSAGKCPWPPHQPHSAMRLMSLTRDQ